MLDPLLFAVYATLFVAILYAAEHFVSTRLSALHERAGKDRWTTQKSRSNGQDGK